MFLPVNYYRRVSLHILSQSVFCLPLIPCCSISDVEFSRFLHLFNPN